MLDRNKNIPFTYQRGKVKYSGRTDSDRRSARIDTILYWVYRIIIAIAILIAVIIGKHN